MTRDLTGITSLLRDEDGPTAVEYAVMLALIFVACFAIIAILGGKTSAKYATAANGW